ncbi:MULTISPECIES: cytochrome C oxidase subunit IV family protein [Protofrankia]|uniref:Cytochrome c oxidase subunit IV n=1 Tax=Protofrankia coriariae TaxID=1562887 RepID=A0ABR5EZ05_9ACTN|nr:MULTISPECIES: cytochrome C oxidase subunit IV family protein [Protofrankia]KLL09694.1 hypothetical protein FrCorBMG51_23100 [Protofrankia coriariae]ONH31579.1 hypothetical protein BL254_22830 [Protofrankia sp. BMG5.30]
MNSADSAVAVWWVLAALTTGSFVVIEGGLVTSIAAVLVIVMTAYKVRLIILHFIEARHGPAIWRLLYLTWAFVMATIIVVGHYTAIIVSCSSDCFS